MSTNREIVANAFDAWMAGTAPPTTIFAPDIRFEIVGHSAIAGVYASSQAFMQNVLQPVGARFVGSEMPFGPVSVRNIHVDDDSNTVIVIWEGEGITTIGTTYRNTYAWFLTLEDGLVVNATAFFDAIALNELWESVVPA